MIKINAIGLPRFLILILIKTVTCGNGNLKIHFNSNASRIVFDTINDGLNIGTEISMKFSETTVNTESSILHNPKDRHFKTTGIPFKDYMKDVDLTIIPGYREDDDFENWIPPEEIQRDMPFYLSGFDYEDRPIWVLEYGKYNYTKYSTKGRKYQTLFYKYSRYLTYVSIKSLALRSTPERRITQHSTLIDFEGLTPDHILNPKALQLQLRWISTSRHVADKFNARIVALNVNMLTETLFTLARSFLLSQLEKVVIFGTNKAQWESQILQYFPKDQIPEWYGGSKGFKPVFVHG